MEFSRTSSSSGSRYPAGMFWNQACRIRTPNTVNYLVELRTVIRSSSWYQTSKNFYHTLPSTPAIQRFLRQLPVRNGSQRNTSSLGPYLSRNRTPSMSKCPGFLQRTLSPQVHRSLSYMTRSCSVGTFPESFPPRKCPSCSKTAWSVSCQPYIPH